MCRALQHTNAPCGRCALNRAVRHVGAKLQTAFWHQRPRLPSASRRTHDGSLAPPPHGHASREPRTPKVP
eukprot:5691064-Prymnesium_polylepis.1